MDAVFTGVKTESIAFTSEGDGSFDGFLSFSNPIKGIFQAGVYNPATGAIQTTTLLSAEIVPAEYFPPAGTGGVAAVGAKLKLRIAAGNLGAATAYKLVLTYLY